MEVRLYELCILMRLHMSVKVSVSLKIAEENMVTIINVYRATRERKIPSQRYRQGRRWKKR